MKTVLITGVRGMDGSTLADKYLEKGWLVIGLDHWEPTASYPNLANAFRNKDFIWETGDICEKEYMYRLFKKYEPDVVYNMAAISLVPESFKIPVRIMNVNTMSLLNMLEIIREHFPKTKIYQASSSEQIGSNTEENQNTDSKMLPTSPYAVAKLASYHFMRVYRQAYGIFAVNGMLWNHEGPRRGPNFVTRKITRQVAKIFHGSKIPLKLGNIDAYRDWGLSDDYCDAMILMMEADKPDDYAVNTGEAHSVREFVEKAFHEIGRTLIWKGKGIDEKAYDQNGNVVVEINEKYYRPTEVPYLHGDHSKIKEKLGWTPTTTFEDLVVAMVKNDVELEGKECQK